MLRSHVHSQLLDDPGQTGRLAGWQLKDQPGQGGGVHDRILQWRSEPATDEVGVEGVMAVLDQHRPARKAQEGSPGIAELGRPRQHRSVDEVALFGVGIDRRTAVDQGVEEGQRPTHPKALGADLQDQERGVAGGLDIERHEVGGLEEGVRTNALGIDDQLLEEHRGHPPGFQVDADLSRIVLVLLGLHSFFSTRSCGSTPSQV